MSASSSSGIRTLSTPAKMPYISGSKIDECRSRTGSSILGNGYMRRNVLVDDAGQQDLLFRRHQHIAIAKIAITFLELMQADQGLGYLKKSLDFHFEAVKPLGIPKVTQHLVGSICDKEKLPFVRMLFNH